MMKKIIIIYLVLALIGCSTSNDEPGFGMENTETAIRFATGMAPAITTRGPIISNGGLVDEDIAGVQILRDDAPVAFVNGITAKVAEAIIEAENVNNKNLMSVSPIQHFKVDHSDVSFMAYHPVGNELSSGIVKYTINGTQDIITSNVDKAEFGSKEEVNFQFIHQLAHVRLQVRAQNDGEAGAFGNLTKAFINVPINLELSINSAEFQLEKSVPEVKANLSFLPNSEPVVLKGGTQLIGELMIYPEYFEDITLEFTYKPEQSFTLNWDSSATNLLKPGTTNTITIDLRAFEIEFSATVTPWGEGNNGGEEISIGGS